MKKHLLFCLLLLSAALGLVRPAWGQASKKILSASNIETFCKHAATDAKEFLRVVEDEGKRFRGGHTVWVLGLQDFSKQWSFAPEETEETERLHQVSVKLGRALASPGRIPSEFFSVATTRPTDELWQRLTRSLENPKENWLEEKARIGNGIGWVVYGYLLDVPGREKPYVILKMTDVKDRLLTWGGCFSMDAKEPGHRDDLLYPECKKIAARLDIPSWAQPNIGAFMASTYWFQNRALTEEKTDEEVFADLLILEFIRTQTLRPESRWVDPMLVKRFASSAEQQGNKEGEAPAGINYRILSELYHAPEWQRLESFITGSVELERPQVKSALLKCVKVVPAKTSGEFLDAFVLSGFCSEARDYAARRDWVRRAVELGLQGTREKNRILRVMETQAFEDGDRFRDILEIAIAQPEIPFCKVVEASSPETSTAGYKLLAFADAAQPPRSLYSYALETATGSLVWARNQARPGGEGPDASYQEYCNKLQISMRGGTPDYGQFPCLLWYLSPRSVPPTPSVGRWNISTTGLELAVSLIDPSRPFLQSTQNRVFGEGDYAELIRSSKELQKGLQKPLRTILFQMLERGKTDRPAFIVKYLDPANGRIDWAYYDEPAGTPLPVDVEDDLLDKMRKAVEGLLKGPESSQDEGKASVVGAFNGNDLLLSLGQRPYEMLVTQLAVRRRRPPIEWAYLLATGIAPPEAGIQALLHKDLNKTLNDQKIASLLQAEWVPSSSLSERHPGLPPRQLILKESSPFTLNIEKLSASPALLAQGEPGPSSGRYQGTNFLHHVVRTLMGGAKNAQEWETLPDLKEKAPLLEKVLEVALKDYAMDANLTQNIVLHEGFSRRQLVSTGTSEASVAAAQGFPGLLSDIVLTGSNPDSFLLGVREISIEKSEPPGSVQQVGTSVGRLFPPDWRERFPDGVSLLEMPDLQGVALIRGNMEFLIRQAGFPLLDTLALRQQMAQPLTGVIDPAAIPTELLKKHGEEQQLQTVQISLSLRHFRTFLLEDSDGKLHLVLSAEVHPSAESLYPRNQILGSFPDVFRYFLVQPAPAGEDGKNRLTDLILSQLLEGGKQDIDQLKKLWGDGKIDESRQWASRVVDDLAQWSKNFPAFSDTVHKVAQSLADEAIRLETVTIRSAREKVSAENHKAILDSVRSSSSGLIQNLESWAASHPPLKKKVAETSAKLVEDALAIHGKTILALLDETGGQTDPFVQNQVEQKLKTVRFLAHELFRDMIGWVGSPASMDDRLKEQAKTIGARFASVHKSRANSLFAEANKLKKKDKDLKKSILVSLRDHLDNCLKDLEAWSATFPDLAATLTSEKVRTPNWARKDWSKSKPVPASTIQDALSALTEEISKLK